jgi:hypothetical protein
MNVSQLVKLTYKEKQKLADLARQVAFKRIHGQPIDPIQFTEVVNATGPVYQQYLEIEKLKIKLEQQQADVAKAAAAAEGPKARRDAKLAKVNQRIADLQAQIREVQATIPAISKEDSEVIDRPQKLQGVADGTAGLVNSMGNSLWRMIRDADWSVPVEVFEGVNA